LKHLYIILCLPCVFIIIFLNGTFSSDWKFYGITRGDDDAYYDRDSIEYLDEGSLRVWELHILSDETKGRIIHKAYMKGIDIIIYDDAAYGMFLTEIHCKKKEYITLYAFLYDKHLYLLNRTEIKEKPHYILEGTSEDALYRAVCMRKNRQ